jgi:hypothetical protein
MVVNVRDKTRRRVERRIRGRVLTREIGRSVGPGCVAWFVGRTDKSAVCGGHCSHRPVARDMSKTWVGAD